MEGVTRAPNQTLTNTYIWYETGSTVLHFVRPLNTPDAGKVVSSVPTAAAAATATAGLSLEVVLQLHYYLWCAMCGLFGVTV